MTDSWFVDTNVLVYAVDTAHPAKKSRAMHWIDYLWRVRSARLSYQVLQEFYVTATQKLTPVMDRDVVRADIRSLLAWNPVAVDAAAMERAWMIQDRYKLSWWDSLIVATALTAGCSHLLTEDLHDGQVLDGLRVQNPFTREPPP